MPTTKLLAMLFIVAAVTLCERLPEGSQLTVHEWGTFTSVAGLDGRAVPWAPLHGPGDLPCFVERLGNGYLKFANGLVRMETPVLYFYSPRPLTLSVRVGFPQGWITEWFPKASTIAPAVAEATGPGNGRIEWDKVEVLPGVPAPKLPGTRGASHYYAARNTDSAPIRIGDQWEKLIFYRGIGNFETPLRPVFQPDGRLHVTSSEPIGLAIWFENRNGKVAYRIVREIKDQVDFHALEPGSLEPLLAELTGYLVQFGLYRKEAEAMVETWRDSWFEPGSRLFYITARSRVDELLPLQVAPQPSAVARVFVGRTELLAPWVRETMRTGEMRQFGRFAAPFLFEMTRSGDNVKQVLNAMWAQPVQGPICVE